MLRVSLAIIALAPLVDGFGMSSSLIAASSSRLGAAQVSSRSALRSAVGGVQMTLKPEQMDRPTEVVVGSPLPRVYVYDHCPFCVRARCACLPSITPNLPSLSIPLASRKLLCSPLHPSCIHRRRHTCDCAPAARVWPNYRAA